MEESKIDALLGSIYKQKSDNTDTQVNEQNEKCVTRGQNTNQSNMTLVADPEC